MPAPISVIGDVYTYWGSQELAAEVNRAVGRGLKAAAIFLAARVREILSVPAPRVRVQETTGGAIEYRAGWLSIKGIIQGAVSPFEKQARTVDVLKKKKGVPVIEQATFTPSPATPFAPPRKLSGHLRRSVTWELDSGLYRSLDFFEGASARVGTNVHYGKTLELGQGGRGIHKFLLPTLLSNAQRIAQIIGDTAASGSASVRTS